MAKAKAGIGKSGFGNWIARSLDNLNSSDDGIRRKAVERLSVCRPKTLEKYKRMKIVSSVARHLQKEHDPMIRRKAVLFLGKHGKGSVLPLIKKSVFDLDRVVREAATGVLAKRIGWKKTILFINKRFRKAVNAGNVPSAFFSTDARYKHRAQKVVWHVGVKGRFSSWGSDQWRSIKDHAPIFASTTGQLLEAGPMTDKSGKKFSVNGIPVFVGYTDLGYSSGGRYIAGFLMVDYRLDSRDSKAVAWHEFGEIFSHEAGRAFEFAFLKKEGNLKEYSSRHPQSAQGFKRVSKNWETPR